MRAGVITLVAAVALGALSPPAAAGATAKPMVTKVAPNLGPTAGGTAVTVTGHNFTGVQAVRFGGVDARFHRVSSTQLKATSPAHAAGLVPVEVVTASGRGFRKGGFDYAKPAARPIGAGYLVPHAHAKTGSMRLVVPTVTCAAHENAEVRAVLQDVQKLAANDGWAGSVALKCVDGHAQYRAFIRCRGARGFALGEPLHPHAVVTISYSGDSVGVAVTDGNSGEGAGCGSPGGPPPYANEPAIAFLVNSSSTPPASFTSLAVHATVARGKLANAHPHTQNQRLTSTAQLVPGSIGADGKTFTVRLQHH